MTPIKTLLSRLVLLSLCLGLAGCVWLRLLEVKNQLAEFDQHFYVEAAQDKHFILHIRHPVLLSEDFPYLTKLNPSRTQALPGGGYRWFVDFRLNPARTREQAAQTIVFAMTFTKENKLAAFDFSPLFLEMAPAVFLEASIRCLGLGKVDRARNQMRVDPEDLPRLDAQLPTRKAIVSVVGPPEQQFPYQNRRVLLYHFKADSVPIDPEYEPRRMAEVKLFFDPATDELVRLVGRFAGLKLAIDYRKFMAAPAGARDKTARAASNPERT